MSLGISRWLSFAYQDTSLTDEIAKIDFQILRQ